MIKGLAYLTMLALTASGAGWAGYEYLGWGKGETTALTYETVAVERGEIRRVVTTSGAVRALVTVQVGSQLSGQVSELKADFNSEVKAGDLLARLDPAIYERRVAQAKADLSAAEAALLVERAGLIKAEATLEQAKRNRARQKILTDKKLAPQSALDLAARDEDVGRAEIDVAKARIASAEATVSQRQAQLEQAQIDLERTEIRSPIDGVVISRLVDLGQTVAASLQAPQLFLIAQDMRKIQIEAQVNEADVGFIAEGNAATFTVDAYPERKFTGTVAQVRLAATELQNIVTYTVIIVAGNDDRRLFPGMTANAEIVTGRIEDTIRVPNEALRFKPRREPGEASGRSGRGGRMGAERLQRMLSALERDVGLGPDQLETVKAEMAKLMQELTPKGPTGPERNQDQTRQLINAKLEQVVSSLLTEAQRPAFEAWRKQRDQTRSGTVWVLDATGALDQRFVRLGLGDDQNTAVTGGELKEGEKVVVRARAAAVGS